MEADFLFSDRINVITGDNGSGKTSVLEALTLLSTGKSFRTPNIKKLISHEEHALSVSARTRQGDQVGFSFNRTGDKKVRVNQQNSTQITAAHHLPVLCVDPNGYLFLENSPQYRRRFFDWMMFHVKPQYLTSWQHAKKTQQNINALLKQNNNQDYDFWVGQYLQYANEVNQLRLDVFDAFQHQFLKLTDVFLPGLETEVFFYPGWRANESLADVLLTEKQTAFRLGQLTHGIHRMDLRFKSNTHTAKDVLSRGQKKMMALACYLTCLNIMDQHAAHPCVLCLDDLDAELDADNTTLVMQYLKERNNQVLISSLNAQQYQNQADLKVFHVEH